MSQAISMVTRVHHYGNMTQEVTELVPVKHSVCHGQINRYIDAWLSVKLFDIKHLLLLCKQILISLIHNQIISINI
jgi:hypothetical protein